MESSFTAGRDENMIDLKADDASQREAIDFEWYLWKILDLTLAAGLHDHGRARRRGGGYKHVIM